jgi:hypothetical protein
VIKSLAILFPVILLLSGQSGVAQASTLLPAKVLAQTRPECYVLPTQSDASGGGAPPISLNPADWIGWVFGQILKGIAGAFFLLTNQVINWGIGCSDAGINFTYATPDYIVLDASRAANWQLIFYSPAFVGAAILLQFSWVAFSTVWKRQAGLGFAGAEEALVRTLLGLGLVLMSSNIITWSIGLCNAINELFSNKVTLFDRNAFQVDAGGNIFNTVLAMAAALVSLLLVMQMATRYIYIIFLAFLFPLGGILWANAGTQRYAALMFSSWVATIVVQPLQLGVLYVTSNVRDGVRDDTSLSMVFGICGMMLALGIPRIINSVLGGQTPVGARGLIFGTSLIFSQANRLGKSIRGRLSGRTGGGSAGGNSGGGGKGNGSGSGSNPPRSTPKPVAGATGTNSSGEGSTNGSNTSLRGGGTGTTRQSNSGENRATEKLPNRPALAEAGNPASASSNDDAPLTIRLTRQPSSASSASANQPANKVSGSPAISKVRGGSSYAGKAAGNNSVSNSAASTNQASIGTKQSGKPPTPRVATSRGQTNNPVTRKSGVANNNGSGGNNARPH